MASSMYNNYKKNISKINWEDNAGTTVKVLLVDSNYVVDIDTHLNKSDIDALSVEVSGTGYTAGGQAITNRVITIDNANDWASYDADDIVWASSTIIAHGAIVYLDTGDASTSTLISYIDFGADKASSDGDFTIQFHVDGVFRVA